MNLVEFFGRDDRGWFLAGFTFGFRGRLIHPQAGVDEQGTEDSYRDMTHVGLEKLNNFSRDSSLPDEPQYPL